MKQEIKEGAAPVEATSAGADAPKYPLRALVVASGYPTAGLGRGETISVRKKSSTEYGTAGFNALGKIPDDDFEYFFFDHELQILDAAAAPSPEPAEAAPAGAETDGALRDAVERFLAAKDALDNIPEGEAGDEEIGRRAEEAAGHHEDMDAALEDMRAALTKAQGSR